MAAGDVDEFDQGRLADAVALVGDQAWHGLDGVLEGAAEPVLQRGQALVLVDTGRSAVADGDDADADWSNVIAHLAHFAGLDELEPVRGKPSHCLLLGAPGVAGRHAHKAAELLDIDLDMRVDEGLQRVCRLKASARQCLGLMQRFSASCA